jgi:hypothetical protein
MDVFEGGGNHPHEINGCLAASAIDKGWDTFLGNNFKAFLSALF